MAMDLSKEQMKERIFNYIEYMEDKDMQDIAAQLYNISKVNIDIVNYNSSK